LLFTLKYSFCLPLNVGHISEKLKTFLLCLLGVMSIIFADVTSGTICSEHFNDICSVSFIVLFHVAKWFIANKLAMNEGKMIIIVCKK